MKKVLAPHFYEVHQDIIREQHTHYWLSGGRGSGKSSFVSLEIVDGIRNHPDANAVVFRKVRNTLRDSVFAQMEWAIGLMDDPGQWKITASAERIVYHPTGQCILFRGLDRAVKIKSLKPVKGYFRYLWFEELSEFSGAEEIRSVIQSVLRGGDRYCCFCTFNPPRSNRSWVNSEVLIPRPDRLVHRSDYRTVPPEWLGEQFLIEAEHLRETRPEQYANEYLGQVNGTGTEVFHNLTLREIPDSEVNALPDFCRGIDFGYAADPLHYTVCSYDAARRRLRIFYELHIRRMSNAALAEKIREEMSQHGTGAVCCDSADPKSVDDLLFLGIRAYGAKKGPGSVGWGMRFLSEEVGEIIIDPVRCPHTAREFSGYEFLCGPSGEPLPSYPDRENHSIDAVRYALEDRIRRRFFNKGGIR